LKGQKRKWESELRSGGKRGTAQGAGITEKIGAGAWVGQSAYAASKTHRTSWFFLLFFSKVSDLTR